MRISEYNLRWQGRNRKGILGDASSLGKEFPRPPQAHKLSKMLQTGTDDQRQLRLPGSLDKDIV